MKSYLSQYRYQLLFAVALLIGTAFGVVDPAMAAIGGLVLATEAVKSNLITNRDAVPTVISTRTLQGADVKHCRAVVTIGQKDVASTYTLFGIPSNAVPISLRISSPDIGTTTTVKFGINESTANGGAVVSANLFAAAVILNAGAVSKFECLGGASISSVTIANAEKRVWELAALAKDPAKMYDVVMTTDGAADGTGVVLVELDYVAG